jgi:hypothetical protein
MRNNIYYKIDRVREKKTQNNKQTQQLVTKLLAIEISLCKVATIYINL